MIAHLTGNILNFSNDSLILDVNGVGYEVFVSVTNLERLKSSTVPVSLLIYTAVREDNLSLFGFLTSQEKQIFLKLISVSGIGPKLALSILSKISTEDLIRAIFQKDLLTLTSISGIGKKTAERLVVELKDKLLSLSKDSSLESGTPKITPLIDDLLSALLNLGYNKIEAEKTLKAIRFTEPTNFEKTLKESLQALSK